MNIDYQFRSQIFFSHTLNNLVEIFKNLTRKQNLEIHVIINSLE